MLPLQAPTRPSAELAFGRCVIRSAARQVLLDGQPAKLGARAFDVLMALVERRGTIVGKNELLDIVWPGLVVEENNLQVHISTLRKLLGAQSIVTIPGKGYQFAARQNDTPDAAPVRLIVTSAASINANLPPLLGRETELAALASMLPSHRLITITGAGGMGKTRLAQAAGIAATHDRQAYPDGVWLVEFAPVSDWQGVLASIAQTLGIALDACATVEPLAARVAERKMLIVFDNCEHVIAHIAAVATALLRTAPEVHLLATSQEPLKLPDERVMRLGGLTYPDTYVQTHRVHAPIPLLRTILQRTTKASARFYCLRRVRARRCRSLN